MSIQFWIVLIIIVISILMNRQKKKQAQQQQQQYQQQPDAKKPSGFLEALKALMEEQESSAAPAQPVKPSEVSAAKRAVSVYDRVTVPSAQNRQTNIIVEEKTGVTDIEDALQSSFDLEQSRGNPEIKFRSGENIAHLPETEAWHKVRGLPDLKRAIIMSELIKAPVGLRDEE